MRWLLILVLLGACHIRAVTVEEAQPESFWCLDRWAECYGDFCPFDSYFEVRHNQCFDYSSTCIEKRDVFLRSHYKRQGVDGWRYNASCYRSYHAYCFRGLVPGDPEYCWSSYYNCSIEKPRGREFSPCYRRNKP